MARKVTRVVQNEWALARDEWLASGGTFETWYWARVARRRQEREAVDERIRQREVEAEARWNDGTATLSDVLVMRMVLMRRAFAAQIINGCGPHSDPVLVGWGVTDPLPHL